MRRGRGGAAILAPPAPMQATLDRVLRSFEADGLWVAGGDAPQVLRGSDLPSPYRELLDHQRDMTGTLEGFWGGPLTLRALRMERAGEVLLRRVVLESRGRPIAYGAIRIQLAAFDEGAREEILAASIPLGAILRKRAIEHRARALGFFRTEADALTLEGLALESSAPLFGRLAQLDDGRGRTLAEVVEILPPIEDSPA